MMLNIAYFLYDSHMSLENGEGEKKTLLFLFLRA